MLKLKVTGLILLSSVLFSCGGNDENIDETPVNDSIVVTADTSNNEVEEKTSSLPSPLQIAYVFKKSGAAFNTNLVNDDANASKYNTSSFKRAINFGVYSTDLAYCIFNKKSQDAKDYLKACKILGESLGLNQAFESDNMAQRFDKNLGKEDSIARIVSELQMKTDALLEQNKQKHISVVAFTGAWIESMFIASESYGKDKNKKVLASLLEQLSFSEVVIHALKDAEKAEADINTISSSINDLNTKFNEIASIKKLIENDEDMDFQSLAVTDAEFGSINSLIKELRTKIVN
jgi:hypothetical protein